MSSAMLYPMMNEHQNFIALVSFIASCNPVSKVGCKTAFFVGVYQLLFCFSRDELEGAIIWSKNIFQVNSSKLGGAFVNFGLDQPMSALFQHVKFQ